MPKRRTQGSREPRAPCGEGARFFQTDNRRIGCFLAGSVFAGGLAQLLAGLRDVEDIVNNLEGQPDITAEIGERLKLSCGAIGAHAAETDGAA